MKSILLSLIGCALLTTASAKTFTVTNSTTAPIAIKLWNVDYGSMTEAGSLEQAISLGQFAQLTTSYNANNWAPAINGDVMRKSVWTTIGGNGLRHTNTLASTGQRVIIRTWGLEKNSSYDFITIYGIWENASMEVCDFGPVSMDSSTTAGNASCSGGQCPISGIPTYQFNAQQGGLRLQQNPIEYEPPVGPAISFPVYYDQYAPVASANLPNLGPQWAAPNLSYVEDQPDGSSSTVNCQLSGGGYETYTGIGEGGNVRSLLQKSSQTTLVRTSDTSYERVYPNGSRDTYAFVTTNQSGVRQIFRTQSSDPAGNTVQYAYQPLTNGVQLTAVVDAAGQTNTLRYEHPTDAFKITAIEDPHGKVSQFLYASVGGVEQLAGIVEPSGITNLFGYANGIVSAMTTPYGTTTFRSSSNAAIRMIEATDPLGATEHMEFRAATASTSIPTIYIPSGILADNNLRGTASTYYWSKKAWAENTNVSNAHITHWAFVDGKMTDIPLWTKAPKEDFVFYKYPGQTNALGGGLTLAQPSLIARNQDDGTVQKTTIAYDAFGNATNIVDAIGRTTAITYDTNGVDLLEVRQKSGTNTWASLASFLYNNYLPIYAVVGGVTNWAGYNAAGQIVGITNGLGEITTFDYDNGYLTAIHGNRTTNSVSLAYDANGRLQAATDFEGYSVAYAYDALDRITNVAFPDGTSITTIYDKLDPVAIKGRDNRWTYQTFSAPGQLTDVQDPSGNITHYEWCACGSLDSITDPKGQTTLWTRDSQSRITSKFYPDFSQTTYSYESKLSRLKEILDAAGKKTALLYNADNTLKSLSFSGGPATPGVTNTYDTNYSRLTRTVDGIGTTTFSYVTNGLPGAGNLQAIDGPLANDTISFTYDSLGRAQTTQIGTNITGVLRDDLGRIYSVSNLLGTTTVEYIGDSSRPSRLTKPVGFITEFAYSDVSDGFRVTNVTHTQFQVPIMSFGYVYDSLGRITTMTETTTNAATAWGYEYDLAGRLVNATQRDGAGAVLHRYVYGYDKAGNRISEQIDTAVATESVNVANQITSRTGGGIVRVGGFISETGTVKIAGSPARMLTTTNFVGEVAASIGTNWFDVVATDLSGNKTTNWYQVPITANGLDTTLTYDAAGNTLAKSNVAGVMTFGWDGADRCTAISNGNSRTSLAYDGNSRWARITEYSATNIWEAINWTILTNATVTDGNVLKTGGAAGSWDASAATSTSLIDNGGIRCETQVGDTNSRVILSLTRSTNQALATMEYSLVIGSDTSTFYVRELGSAMTANIAFTQGDSFQITVQNGQVSYYRNGQWVYTSATSAAGKVLRPFIMLAKSPGCFAPQILTNPTADRRFVWNGVTLAEERDWTGTNVVQRFFTDGFWRTGTNYFYVKDHLGSVREVYDSNGVLQARFTYDPYGTRTQTYGTMWVDFGFAGLFELKNGIKLAVWRGYDGARWLSKDPIKEDGGLNLYAYCGGDPIGFTDDSGLNRARYWKLAHRWIEVDVWENGKIVGRVALDFAPHRGDNPRQDTNILPPWRELWGLGSIPIFYVRTSNIDSTEEQDTALLNRWREIMKKNPRWRWDYNCTHLSDDDILMFGIPKTTFETQTLPMTAYFLGDQHGILQRIWHWIRTH